MNNIDRLIELFREFPGIGPRQAKRFVYYLLARGNGYTGELSKLITEVKSSVSTCDKCFRFYSRNGSTSSSCPVCLDSGRDHSELMIVSHDVDFENIERTGSFSGYYFVLGGTVPILEKEPSKRIRQRELLEQIEIRARAGLREIVMALDYTPEGENTMTYLNSLLRPICEPFNIKISTLGRGLSTGTELEYSDPDTIRNALKNRK